MSSFIGGFILALAVLCGARVVVDHPLTCPAHTYVEGVRPSGETRCLAVPPPNCGEPKPPYNQPCVSDVVGERWLLVCTGGAHPIWKNERVVGCQR